MRVKSTGNYREEGAPPSSHSQWASSSAVAGAVRLNFKNHCLFCLQPQQPTTILEIVRENPKNLKSFQPILHYLTGTDPTFDKSKGECEWMGIPAMENLPPMCPPCYGVLAELYELHEKLLNLQVLIQKQTELARRRVPLGSQGVSRRKFYERVLSSGVSEEEGNAVQKFVDKLHNKIIVEVSEKKKVIFPSRPPPDFVPNPEALSISLSDYSTVTTPTIDPLDPDPVAGTSMECASNITLLGAASQLVDAPSCSSMSKKTEVVILPPEDIKYENEDVDEEEVNEPDMIIPDMDMDMDVLVTPERSPSQSESEYNVENNPSSPASSVSSEYTPTSPRRRTSARVCSSVRSKRRRTLGSKSNSLKLRKKREGRGESGKIRHTRVRDIRRVIDGKSTYVAQYCDLCAERIPISEIRGHLENIHNVKDFVTCCPNTDCPLVFSCRGKLEKHLITPNPRKCMIAADIPPGRLTRICETCGFETKCGHQFRKHVQQKHELNMKEKTFRCPILGCTKKYAVRQSLEDHINFHDLRFPSTDHEDEEDDNEESIKHVKEDPEMKEECQPSTTSSFRRPSPATSTSEDSSKLKIKRRHAFEPTAPPTKLQKVIDEQKKKPSKSRLRDMRKVINGKSTYVAQLCDLCGQKLPISEVRGHLESGHNLKDFVTKCRNPSCNFYFSCRGKMDRHICSQNPPKCGKAINVPRGPITKICETCGFQTRSGRQFRNHLLQQHEFSMKEKTFLCPILDCTERYALRQALEDHIYLHDLRPPPTNQECSICKKLIKIEDIPQHLREAHAMEDAKLIPCKRCPHMFPSWEYLLDHAPEHQFCYGLSCDICNDGVKYRQYDTLRRHYFNVHQIGKQLLCEYCDKSLFTQSALALHKQKQHSNNKAPSQVENNADESNEDVEKLKGKVKCEFCPRPTYLSPGGLRNHRLRFHKKEFDERKKKHGEKIRGKVKCELCPTPTYFSAQGSLRTHKIKFHEGEPFTCKYCSKPFITIHSLTRHHLEHTGILREYKCKFEGCGRTFQNQTLLGYHELGRHSDSQPYQCEKCGKKFNYRKAMKAHIDRMHLGKLNHLCVCETCGKTVSRKSLRIHMLIHTGDRPHSCHICQKTFRHKEAMLTHVKAHQEKGESFRPKNRNP